MKLCNWWTGLSVPTRNILRGVVLALLVVVAIKLAICAVIIITHSAITLNTLLVAAGVSIASGAIMFLVVYCFDCKVLRSTDRKL
jgi:hypothetical protein